MPAFPQVKGNPIMGRLLFTYPFVCVYLDSKFPQISSFSFFIDLSLANLVSRSFISVSKVIILWACSFLPCMMLD